MKAKKLLALGFAAIMMVSAMALPASAAEIQPMNNHDDTSFAFSFNNLGRSNTTGRAKQDDTGTYINAYTMCNGGFDVYVDGYNTNTGNWVDCTDKATRGQPHLRTTYNPGLISQWVYENGYRTARLGGYKLFASQSVTGVWSPDSQGSYRYLGSST